MRCGWNGTRSQYVIDCIRTERPDLLQTIRFPVISGFFGGTVCKVQIRQGDCLFRDSDVLEVEDSAAFLNLPSETSGTVVAIHKSVGDLIEWKDPIADVIPLEYTPNRAE